MKKFALIASSFLTITNASFASDFSSSFSTDELIDCTRNNPCYYDGGQFYHLENADSGWDSHTIITFTTSTVFALGALAGAVAIPVCLNFFNRGIDYLAYANPRRWGGLRDGGGVAQTDQIRRVANSVASTETDFAAFKAVISERFPKFEEQKELFTFVSSAIENTHESAQERNDLLTKMIEEIEKGQKNSSQLIKSLAQQQKNLTDLALSIQKESIQMQESQKKTSDTLSTALTSFTEALKELKPQES